MHPAFFATAFALPPFSCLVAVARRARSQGRSPRTQGIAEQVPSVLVIYNHVACSAIHPTQKEKTHGIRNLSDSSEKVHC